MYGEEDDGNLPLEFGNGNRNEHSEIQFDKRKGEGISTSEKPSLSSIKQPVGRNLESSIAQNRVDHTLGVGTRGHSPKPKVRAFRR